MRSTAGSIAGSGGVSGFTARLASGRRGAVQCKAAVQFSKFQGLGNDFILVDDRGQGEPSVTPEQAIRLCDRNFGVGGDGVIFALPASNGGDYSMRIYNSDGSEPEMCGNGIRCLAKFVADIDGTQAAQHRVDTLGGVMQPAVQSDGQVCVDMGPPILEPSRVPTSLPATQDGAVVQADLEVDGRRWQVTCVSMGNPHALIYSSGDGQQIKHDEVDLHRVGPMFERHPVFPARINTHFVEVVHRGHVKMAVWERGAGPTLACGTGACAVLVAGVLEGRLDRTCRVDLPGGPLHIEWRESDNHVYMTGPAEHVFTGSVEL